MLYREITLTNAGNLNYALYARFMELSGTAHVRQTHHFRGRYENAYIDLADIPQVEPVRAVVLQQAAAQLGRAPDTLRAGFWFNPMGPGHSTAPHHHDENDELLSAVYYIRVPPDSGDLLLHGDDELVRVQPEAGKLVLFAPAVTHEVTENRSTEMRLSVAFNVGPVGK